MEINRWRIEAIYNKATLPRHKFTYQIARECFLLARKTIDDCEVSKQYVVTAKRVKSDNRLLMQVFANCGRYSELLFVKFIERLLTFCGGFTEGGELTADFMEAVVWLELLVEHLESPSKVK
jgi:hypothetical protein